MFQTFCVTLVQMLRIMALIALGFAFNRLKVIPRAAEKVISLMSVKLFCPMLCVYTFIMQCTAQNLIQNSRLILYGAGLFAISVAVSTAFSKKYTRDEYQQGVIRYALAMPNTGAFCTSLVLAFRGVEGNFIKSLFLFSQTVLTYTWGVIQLQPGAAHLSARAALKKLVNVNTVALAAGVVLGLINAREYIPQIVLDNVKFFGDCYVPFSLFVVGYCVADWPVKRLTPSKEIIVFTVLRLLLIPAAAIYAMKAISAPASVILLTALSFSSPCGMNAVVFPVAYGKDCRMGASMVLFTSILSVITMPLIYALANAIT